MTGVTSNAGLDQATAPLPAVVERMREYRRRLKRGGRCATVELREAEIIALVDRRYLAPDDRMDTAAIGAALGELLDRIPPPRWPMAPCRRDDDRVHDHQG